MKRIPFMGKNIKAAYAHSVGSKLAYVYRLSMMYTSTCIQGKAILAHLLRIRPDSEIGEDE